MLIITSSSPLISPNSIALILALSFLLYPSYSSSTGLVAEEKVRLGSTPPICQNRCNMCHPCMAVQVPTTPSRRRVNPSDAEHDSENRYSNYKPLGWKCRCQGHFYIP